MNQIYELPEPNGAGLNFNYESWGADAVVTLCNVPWNNDYRDITTQNVDDYIATLSDTLTIRGLSYLKAFAPIRVPQSFNKISKYNYIRVQNASQPIDGGDFVKSYYYFITDVQYIAPNTSQINIQLDVIQTFLKDVTFGNCYIEQGHVGVANENQLDYGGREFLTTPEGLNLGTGYVVRNIHREVLANQTVGNDRYWIMVTSTVSFLANPGNVNNPNLESARGSWMEGLPNGAEIYFFDGLADFHNYMSSMSDKPWVTQGIVSVMAVPNPTRFGITLEPSTIDSRIMVPTANSRSKDKKTTAFNVHWRRDLLETLGERYKHLKKFSVSPYTVFELTTYTGTPIILKPELWGYRFKDNPNHLLRIVEKGHLAPPNARIVMLPEGYNGGEDSVITGGDGDYLDTSTGLFDFPMFSTVNNSYANYLASSVNARAFGSQSAEWSNQKALQGNQVAFNQANESIGLTQEMNAIGINQATQATAQANQHAALGAGVNAASGFMGGPAAGALNALGQGANLAMTASNNNNMLAINTNAANARTGAATRNAGYMRDTNRAYADFAASGDYQNAIAGINAQVEDAKMIPPTTSGQVGGDAFNLATSFVGYDVKLKTIDISAMVSIGEYWLRYGYRVDRFAKLTALHAMSKFTYWKVKELYLSSSTCPETYRQTIRGIFEKGVTVWQNANDIGNIDIGTNKPLVGIRL